MFVYDVDMNETAKDSNLTQAQKEWLRKEGHDVAKEAFCKAPQTEQIRKYGAGVEYIYRYKDGGEAFRVRVNKSECGSNG